MPEEKEFEAVLNREAEKSQNPQAALDLFDTLRSKDTEILRTEQA